MNIQFELSLLDGYLINLYDIANNQNFDSLFGFIFKKKLDIWEIIQKISRLIKIKSRNIEE